MLAAHEQNCTALTLLSPFLSDRQTDGLPFGFGHVCHDGRTLATTSLQDKVSGDGQLCLMWKLLTFIYAQSQPPIL
jgi:hypothetical protein